MEQEFEILRQKLATACELIGEEYFQLPVAVREEGEADTVYRERVYCYELYHQLRCAWGDFGFSLGGEVDKAGHPYFRGERYAQAKPDLLVHQPGNMDRNLACVEVKPVTRPWPEFRADLEKLTWFCQNADYHRGIFIVYGSAAEGVRDDVGDRLRRAVAAHASIDITRIDVLRHLSPGRGVERIQL